MILDDAKHATREAADAAEQVSAHLGRLRQRSVQDFPLSAAAIVAWDDERRERHHAMLRLFEQLYDLASRRLLRGFLLLSGEDPARLSAVNLFRRGEALNAIPSAERWLEIGVTRNILVHDYPTDPERQARTGNLAWDNLDDLRAAVTVLLERLRSEELI